MCEVNIDGTYTNISDYNIEIESIYYNQDFDVACEEPIDNEINETQTDILFE